VAFYLVGYLLMTLLCFAVMILIDGEGDEQIENYAGLWRRSPFLAGALLVGMLSLAGIPFTVGFLGKFFIFEAAIRQHQTVLVVIGVITVGCGFYYYLKVIRAMFWLEPPNDAPPLQVSPLSRGAIALLVAGILVLVAVVALVGKAVERL
jgi:NADH-quinone oxidoreductase subunit N